MVNMPKYNSLLFGIAFQGGHLTCILAASVQNRLVQKISSV